MTPDYFAALSEVANALQAAVLHAEQIARASAGTATDAQTLVTHVHRATTALQRLRGGVQ